MKLTDLFEVDKVKILDEKKTKEGDTMSIICPWIQADKKNRNGRLYKKSLLQAEVKRLQKSIEAGSLIGAGDHPQSGIADLASASHIVQKLEIDEKTGKGWAQLKIIPTERGRTIMSIIRNNGCLGLSARGFGDVSKEGTVLPGYRLQGVDVVVSQSEPSATFDLSNVFESQNFEEENEVEKDLEKEINALEKASYLGAVESGFKGSEDEWHRMYGTELREMVGLPVSNRETPLQKLTEGQISVRTHTYFLEACSAGFVGSFDEWKQKFPRLVEMAKEVKIVEKKVELKEPFKSSATWSEIQSSGFRGTMQEYQEKFPNITIIKPEPPKKVVAEKALTEEALRQEAGRIFTALSKDHPNSSLVLEDVVALLRKEELAKADKRLRKRAIYIVNASIAGSGSVPSQVMLEKMVSEEIENLKKQREERRKRNWECYRKLLD